MKIQILLLTLLISAHSQAAGNTNFSAFGGLKATIDLTSPALQIVIYAPTIDLCNARIAQELSNIDSDRILHVGECIINSNESSSGSILSGDYSIILKNSPSICLSCPLLNNETFKIFYPDNAPEIEQLYYSYNIDLYNSELSALQKKYNLMGFEIKAWELKFNKKK